MRCSSAPAPDIRAMSGIPGDSLNGVLSANELLTRCNLMRARDFPNYDTPMQPGRRVAVIGAGNTAMDAMRVSLRLGAENVYCIYRRAHDRVPGARRRGPSRRGGGRRVPLADQSGRDPRRRQDGNVRGMRCMRMELGEPDESGRRRPVPVAGSEFEIECDLVVFAIGTNANPIIGQTSKLRLNKRGYIDADDRPRDLDGGRLRGRRHRHRRGDRDRGDGRGAQGRAQHEGLSRHARHRRGHAGARRRRASSSASTQGSATSRACASPERASQRRSAA